MTEDQSEPTGRPHGGVELPPHGIKTTHDYEAAEEHVADTDFDLEDNELHKAGQTCIRCGRVIKAGEDVRRAASGGYEHEFCPPGARPAVADPGGQQ
jgi:hypothetical protein